MKQLYYCIALSGFFGLFGLLMLWHTLLSPSQHFPVALVLLCVITPLLIPMRGLLNARPKSCIWMSYLSLFYVTYGIADAYTASSVAEFYYALLEVFFSLLLCAGCSLLVYDNTP